MSRKLIIIVIIALGLSFFYSKPTLSACGFTISQKDMHTKFINSSLIGVGIISAWGTYNWNYFNRSPHSTNEGWFGQETDSGGADKLGHLHASYITAQGISHFYEYKCFEKDKAAAYGALTSLTIFSFMEFGDAFSDYGFSKEDFIANLLGATYGYYSSTHPAVAEKIDLRWEYGFNPQSSDLTTDYENSKYLFAIKLNGFSTLKDTVLRHFEIHLGYYTRGYDDPLDIDERNIYAGIGFNFTDTLYRHGHHKTSLFLKYYQPPGVYITQEKTLTQ